MGGALVLEESGELATAGASPAETGTGTGGQSGPEGECLQGEAERAPGSTLGTEAST